MSGEAAVDQISEAGATVRPESLSILVNVSERRSRAHSLPGRVKGSICSRRRYPSLTLLPPSCPCHFLPHRPSKPSASGQSRSRFPRPS